MRLTKEEGAILIELVKSNTGFSMFTLYRHLKITPGELFLSIENLKLYALVDLDEDRVKLTKQGLEYYINYLLTVKSIKTSPKVSKIDCLGPRIKINEFYIPQNFEK